MQEKKNYQKELEEILQKLPDKNRTLFLHSCCAPCSSYVLEYLSAFFRITVYYYNPNISDKEEYEKRVQEQKRLIQQLNVKYQTCSPAEKTALPSKNDILDDGGTDHKEIAIRNRICFQEGPYEPDRFYEVVKGLEKCREGGERCEKCFHLRLEQTAMEANNQGYDYFATTLTISPLKNAQLLNQLGLQIGTQQADRSLQFLVSDFKKKNGYKRSVELSEEYNLYRQDFCGCIYSKLQREEDKKKIDNNLK